MSTVFTVGNEANYDNGIVNYGREFMKLGRKPNYPGGFALKSVDDANRLIDEQGKRGEWAVYELEAEWDKHTTPSVNGWWHALIKDSVVLRKVSV